MFGFLKKKGEEAANKISGRTDLLEAICAAAALIAAADGEIEDAEIEATIKAVKATKALGGFDARTVETTINTMMEKAQNGRVGRMQLKNEIRDIAKNAEDSEIVMLVALDVSDSDGENEPAKMKVLQDLAGLLGVNLDKLMAA